MEEHQSDDIVIVKFDRDHLMEDGTAQEASALIRTIYSNPAVQHRSLYENDFMDTMGRDLNGYFLSDTGRQDFNVLYLALDTTHGDVVGVLGATVLGQPDRPAHVMCGTANVVFLNHLAVEKAHQGMGISSDLHHEFENDCAALERGRKEDGDTHPVHMAVYLHPQNNFPVEHERYMNWGYWVRGEVRTSMPEGGRESLILMSRDMGDERDGAVAD